jgi:Family of unknown function (DUF6286)
MSRTDARSTPLRHRPSRAIPALIIGLLMLGAGITLTWISIARLIEGIWPSFLAGPRDWAAGLTWNDPAVWVIGTVLLLAGLALLLLAILPGSFNAIGLRTAAPDTGDPAQPPLSREIVMSRGAVARLVCAHCAHIDGVGTASAAVTGRRVHVTINTPLHETAELRTRVITKVRERLESTGLEPMPRISAAVRSRKS